MKRKNRVYMAVTKDKYELPLIVAETSQELADFLGTTINTIHSGLSHAKKQGKKINYVAVDIEEGNDE